jgi:hypothetical protein
MATKAELEAELAAIKEQEFQAMVDENYPEFKKLEGKFFKVRNNYSQPEKESDYWWMYKQVTKVRKEDVYHSSQSVSCIVRGWSFETTRDNLFEVKKDMIEYAHSLERQIEISEKEFKAAWNKAKAALNELL